MATTVTHVVDPDAGSGYDYDSLYDWEAGEQGDLTGVRDEIAVAKCRCTGGTADTTPFTIAGWTTSQTQYIKVWTDPSESYRHNGTYQTGNKYRFEIAIAGDNDGIVVNQANTRFYGISFQSTQSAVSNSTVLYFTVSGQNRIGYCIFKHNFSASASGFVGVAGSTIANIYIFNSIFYDAINGENAVYAVRGTNFFLRLFNCTFVNNYYAIYGILASAAVNNCLFRSNTYDSNTVAIFESRNNATDKETLSIGTGGSDNRVSQTFTFVNEGADNFHLASNDTGAIGYGLDDPFDGEYTDDIDGQTRTSSWDIGADEYVAAGGLSIPVAWHHYQFAGGL